MSYKKILIRLVLGFLLVSALVLGILWMVSYYKRIPPQSGTSVYSLAKKRAYALKEYAIKHKYDTDHCFLVDYSIPSGQPRFFIWNFATDKIEYSDYCLHGPGKGSTAKVPVFSNEKGSNCSSLGRFVVKKNLYGNSLGEKRSRLISGLDKTNSNARARGLMIHDSYYLDKCLLIPSEHLPLNGGACSGCVTITTAGFRKAKSIIEESPKEILLYTYFSSGE